MNNVQLVVTDQGSNGSYHTKLFIDEQESGILYLNKEQYELISRALKQKCNESGIIFNVENPYDLSQLDDAEEEDYLE
jgi:hypothetical protein